MVEMNMCCGGWTVHDPMTAEDKAVFETALKGLVGCKYEPIVVATQVVNGVNYIYIAKYTTVTATPKVGLAKVYISAVPAGQEPKLVNIETII